MRNAQLAFRRRFRGLAPEREALQSLAEHLDLGEPPLRIEGFDISHSQGSQTVASMVVFEDGKPRKGDYRSFNIKNLEGPDDYASLYQAVLRRYRRVLDETGVLPDLLLIDGGRGQLNAALEALAELGIEETPIVSLAKREEEVYLPSRPEPLRLARRDPGLRLLQAVRDESHRFALSRHRRRRQKATLVSRLDQLSGVGPRRRRLLLKRFGSVRGVRAADERDLCELLGPGLGASIFRQMHPLGATTSQDESPDVSPTVES
jgi:excinuclease ABC subunit C